MTIEDRLRTHYAERAETVPAPNPSQLSDTARRFGRRTRRHRRVLATGLAITSTIAVTLAVTPVLDWYAERQEAVDYLVSADLSPSHRQKRETAIAAVLENNADLRARSQGSYPPSPRVRIGCGVIELGESRTGVLGRDRIRVYAWALCLPTEEGGIIGVLFDTVAIDLVTGHEPTIVHLPRVDQGPMPYTNKPGYDTGDIERPNRIEQTFPRVLWDRALRPTPEIASELQERSDQRLRR